MKSTEMHVFYLLGLTAVGIIWTTVRGDTTPQDSDIMTQEERIEFLAEHNKYRSDASGSLKVQQPTAADMKRMYWSSLLEADAVAWSKQLCSKGQLVHGHSGVIKQPDYNASLYKYGNAIGQNIFGGGGPYYKPAAIIKAYAKETKDYTFSSNTCTKDMQCGHYTQVMWKDSFLVGCGYSRCTNKKNFYSTCNYLPAGNYRGVKPYTEGPPCSGCLQDTKYSFTQCENKTLCVPKDRCSPVTECTVVDQVNCLCMDTDYNPLVGRMVKASGSIHVASPGVVFGLLLSLVAVHVLGHGLHPGYDAGLL